MEETNTTEVSYSNMTSGYVVYGENNSYECSSLPSGLMVFAGVCTGICLCGLVGNGMVLWFLCFHMKRNPFTIYILNLIVTDFSLLLLFLLLILTIFTLTTLCSYLSHFFSYYMQFVLIVEFLCHFFDLSSLGLLTAISVERCILVLFPVWYRCHRPKRLSGIVSGVLWVLAGFLVFSMYLSFNFAGSYETAFADVTIAISMILSSITLISDLCLFIKLRCGSQRRPRGQHCVAVLLNVVFFFVLGVSFCVEVFLGLPSSHKLFPENFLLDLLTCSIDAVIYFLVGSCQQCWFQGSMKDTFYRVLEEQAVSEEESQEPEDTVAETTV